MEFLASIENSALSVWVRESGSLWAYPSMLFLHTVGLGIVVGVSMLVDLRLLGLARRMPIAPLARFLPIIWLGFWLDLASGLILLMADATTKFTNPMFGVKMAFVALAVADILLIDRKVFRHHRGDHSVPMAGRVLAALSIVCWLGAIVAGRLTAYVGAVSGAPGLANKVGG